MIWATAWVGSQSTPFSVRPVSPTCEIGFNFSEHSRQGGVGFLSPSSLCLVHSGLLPVSVPLSSHTACPEFLTHALFLGWLHNSEAP